MGIRGKTRSVFVGLLIFFSLFLVSAITLKIILLDQTVKCPSDASSCSLEVYKNGVKTNTISINKGTDVNLKVIATYLNYVSPINGSCGSSLNSCISGTLNDTLDNSTDKLWKCMGSGGGTNVTCSITKEIYNLNVIADPQLGGTINGIGILCGDNCSEQYTEGTIVNLTANPSADYYLSSWVGCNNISGNKCSIMMNSSKSVTAKFVYGTPPKPSKIIILQMDDCQIWWLRQTCINIGNLHIQKQADLTIGFVPQAITEDTAWGQPLKDWYNNNQGTIEIAEHTYDHSSDYSGWSITNIVTDMNKGKAEFTKLGIYPKTFIPAYDWSANVADGANSAGFNVIIDALENPYDDGIIGNTMILEDGIFCGDGLSSCANKDYASLKTMVDSTISRRGYAVILFHQQDFGDVGSSTYNTLYNKWSSNLDKFKQDGYTFMTANEYREYKINNP